MDLLNCFLRQVVVSRREEGIRRWKGWLREDSSSRPYAWLRPDFVPPSPFLVIKDPQTQSSHDCWLSPIILMLSFVKPGCLISVSLVIQWLPRRTVSWFCWSLFASAKFLGSSSYYGS